MILRVYSTAWVPNIGLSLIYIATQSQEQTSQPHFTTITGGATASTTGNATPEVIPTSKQKSKVKFYWGKVLILMCAVSRVHVLWNYTVWFMC